ncbi:tRNA glutamyl-Q(34) synthetase GluQRS [Nitrosomonas sp. JL21]|uniref:tRNA glutamyl-Q(34) synthetase GluQRS n=1 Tax=Nitrosomonas sp. JL21 TaxID=153949 RepID=UPI00136FEB5C|nr:tRNA glutamyl-Q(34) synthetase GluQRS [Nitrosomonas sp. JL21]MBL8498840.1 tRNA glutamyl-Q(34) synthetase GluQRS [Nitrosomonas sp.]MCC7092388.1 tRNA glutamyl-Q(34) synthetase GluQRS [Nitrosomonas sp.]MXS77992.1 tRNA glutamyl-Q(34) synthetase GluQRS [Nitrosomonas sp. JL21]
MNYRGRFAPSPTGPLHFGSLVAAVGSYLDAKSNRGEWLVRIEDLDRQREVPGAATEILKTLERLGMEWDGEIVHQSDRTHLYQDALHVLQSMELIYPCTCSRKEISDSSIMGLQGPVYPGTCRDTRYFPSEAHALRIRTHDDAIEFKDVLEGLHSQRLQREVGDFVLRRSDGLFAYQLAVVVDDAQQHITHVVRGADLLSSTPRQIYLQQLLGYPTPQYMHLPIVTNERGEKLSKQTHAAPIDVSDGLQQLVDAVRFLGQAPPAEIIEGTIASFWQWAFKNWQKNRIPH